MATTIETLKKSNGDHILPRTRAKAVSMEDGTTVEAAIKESKIYIEDTLTSLTNKITAIEESVANKIDINTTEEDGKFMRVVDGKWTAVKLTDVSEVGA